MNHRLQSLTPFIFWLILLSASLFAQPKLSFHLGGGFYSPRLGMLDPDSNNVIPSLSAFSKNMLIDWGFKYQFYPNARVGYARSNSYHSGKVGASGFLRTISYRMLTFETFYYPRKQMELNFMLAPMYNKGTVKLTAESTSGDWNTLLGSYGNSSVKLSTDAEMTKRWFGLASMIGFRYYIFSWLAVDGKAGFIQNSYSEKKWRLEKEKIDGPTMDIKKLPVFNIHLVLGW